MSAVITIGNTKGGVGKTTISVNLAVEATKDGKSVLIVDTDPQGSAVSFRSERETDDIKAISLITDKLHKDIASFQSSFDLIIIDAGGRDNQIFRSALAACQLLLVPVLPSQFDIWAADDAIKAYKEIQPFNHMQGRLILNQVIEGTKVSKEAYTALLEYREDLPLLEQSLHGRVAYKNSITKGLGVSEYEPNGKAAIEMRNLYESIMEVVR